MVKKRHSDVVTAIRDLFVVEVAVESVVFGQFLSRLITVNMLVLVYLGVNLEFAHLIGNARIEFVINIYLMGSDKVEYLKELVIYNMVTGL